MAGTIDEAALVENLNGGYAVAGGDSGHRAADNNDGEGENGVRIPYLHDQDQILAWIHNSIAYFTPPVRTIVEAYYDSAPKYSYYKGCSTGGAQAFALAQYHPELFDGIVAGCPGNWYSHLTLSFLWNAQASEVNTQPNIKHLIRDTDRVSNTGHRLGRRNRWSSNPRLHRECRFGPLR